MGCLVTFDMRILDSCSLTVIHVLITFVVNVLQVVAPYPFDMSLFEVHNDLKWEPLYRGEINRETVRCYSDGACLFCRQVFQLSFHFRHFEDVRNDFYSV